MKRIIGGLGAAFIYFSAASFITLVVGATVLFAKGSLNREKMVDLAAALYGLDLTEMRAKIASSMEDDSKVQIAYDRVLEARVRHSLDIDLRESAVDKTMNELVNLRNNVISQRNRHDQVVKTFETRLQEIQDIANDQRLQKVQQTLERMKPKQAKFEIMQMVEDKAMHDVVAIMNSLAADKQKKIIAEFKSAEEQQTLHEILNEIRAGRSQQELLNEAKSDVRDVQETP